MLHTSIQTPLDRLEDSTLPLARPSSQQSELPASKGVLDRLKTTKTKNLDVHNGVLNEPKTCVEIQSQIFRSQCPLLSPLELERG